MSESKRISMEVRLPKDVIDAMRIVAKRAGVPLETVIKVVLATESLKWKKQELQP